MEFFSLEKKISSQLTHTTADEIEKHWRGEVHLVQTPTHAYLKQPTDISDKAIALRGFVRWTRAFRSGTRYAYMRVM